MLTEPYIYILFILLIVFFFTSVNVKGYISAYKMKYFSLVAVREYG
jgi:hypothetical protein